MVKKIAKVDHRLDERFDVGKNYSNISLDDFQQNAEINIKDFSKNGVSFFSRMKPKNIIAFENNRIFANLVWTEKVLENSDGYKWVSGAQFEANNKDVIDALGRVLSDDYCVLRKYEEMTQKKICRKCILIDGMIETKIEENGLCNFCNKYELEEAEKQSKRDFIKLEKKLVGVLKSKKNRDYDCLCLYSGGKDSTYMLYQLVKKYKLRVLAFTFDNFFIAPETFRNMNKVLTKLNVDHILFKPSWQSNKSIFKASFSDSHLIHSSKELSYMIGHACWPCFAQIAMHSIKLAVDKGIPSIVVGTTPGQLRQKKYDASSKYNGLVDVYKNMIMPMLQLLKKTNQNSARQTLELSLIKQFKVLRMRLVPFYEFVQYNEQDVLETVRNELGWESPTSTDSCSTNCHLNSLGIQIHKERYGISPYVVPLARDVREGLVRRSDALKAVNSSLNTLLVQNIAKQFDVQTSLSE